MGKFFREAKIYVLVPMFVLQDIQWTTKVHYIAFPLVKQLLGCYYCFGQAITLPSVRFVKAKVQEERKDVEDVVFQVCFCFQVTFSYPFIWLKKMTIAPRINRYTSFVSMIMVFLVEGILKICDSLLKSVLVTDIQDNKKSYCRKAFSLKKRDWNQHFFTKWFWQSN